MLVTGKPSRALPPPRTAPDQAFHPMGMGATMAKALFWAKFTRISTSDAQDGAAAGRRQIVEEKMISRHLTSAALAAVFALGLAGTSLAAGPPAPPPNMNAIQNETQMPSQIDKNAQQAAEDKKRAEEAKAKAKADAEKNAAGTSSK